MGYKAVVSQGELETILGVIGKPDAQVREAVEAIHGVARVVPITKPYKFASRDFKAEDTVVATGPLVIGGGNFSVIAGPCTVESRSQVMESALRVKDAGARGLRGGAFKPRTTPHAFQGLGEEGLKILASAREETGLPIVTEVLSPNEVDLVAKYADVLQIGARNMQNYRLLEAAAAPMKPILLKRGISATLDEFVQAAEYILVGGNPNVILCERGIRTFDTSMRFLLSVGAIPILKEMTHLPVIVDPSHAAGKARYVAPLARAAVAAGADGLIVEVHPNPEEAVVDGPQALSCREFDTIMEDCLRIRTALEVAGRPAW